MTTRPTKKDQVRMAIKNLQHQLTKHLIIQPLSIFKRLFDAGIQVEDVLRLEVLEITTESGFKPKRFMGNTIIQVTSSQSK